MKRFTFRLVPLFALALLSTLLTGGAEDRRKIVATTTQAADLMRLLSAGQDNIELTALMGAGVDPHL